MDDQSLATWLYFIGVILVVAGVAWVAAIRDEIWWWGPVGIVVGAIAFLFGAVAERV